MSATACTHQVQFYGADDALATNVSSFLAVPLLRGEAAVVVATAEHRAVFASALAAAGVDVDAVRREGRLVELDAAETLALLRTEAGIARAAFADVVVRPVTELVARHGAVSAYGEMVGLLTAAGHVITALELEELWSGLMDALPLRVLCGYPLESFPGAASDPALADICAAHDAVADTTALTAAVDLPLGPRAASSARRAVREICTAWGLTDEDWCDDVVLVVSELVGNAVRHAGSRIALALDADAAGVTVSVTDGSGALPAPRDAERYAEDGRGFALIDALAERWGVERRPGGKRVWVRLRPCPTAADVPADAPAVARAA